MSNNPTPIVHRHTREVIKFLRDSLIDGLEFTAKIVGVGRKVQAERGDPQVDSTAHAKLVVQVIMAAPEWQEMIADAAKWRAFDAQMKDGDQ